MVQVRISSEGGEQTFNVDIPFTGEKIKELIRDRTNIPEESQFLFDYPKIPDAEFELIGNRVFDSDTPQHFVLTMGEASQWAYFYIILPPYANGTRVYQKMNCHKFATVKDLMNRIASFNKLGTCEYWLYKDQEIKLADINQNLFQAAVVNGSKLYFTPCHAQCKKPQLPHASQMLQGSQAPQRSQSPQ